MIKRSVMLLSGVFLILACDLHDHNEKIEQMAGVTVPQIKDDECIIACYGQGDEDALIAGYYVVEGVYKEKACQPKNFNGDVSEPDSVYSQKCGEIANCKGITCWAVADTGDVCPNSDVYTH